MRERMLKLLSDFRARLANMKGMKYGFTELEAANHDGYETCLQSCIEDLEEAILDSEDAEMMHNDVHKTNLTH